MWSSQYSAYIYLATTFTLLSLPNTLECCPLSTAEISMLMLRNPNYESDPCYIQWQAAEKLTHIWAHPEEFQESIRESDERQREDDASMSQHSEQENQQHATESKTGVGEVFGYLVVVGVIVGTVCCLICILAAKHYNENGTTTTVPPSNLHQNESPTNQLTSTRPSNASGNNRTVFPSTSNDNDSGGLELATFVPLKVLKRQDSLPSYEDAVKMPSAPLME